MENTNDVVETQSQHLATQKKEIALGPPRIIVAEDDGEMAALLVRAFVKAGYNVEACQTGWDLLKLLGVFRGDDAYDNVALVVSDIRLPGVSGLEVLKACSYAGNSPPVILITAFGDAWTHEQARKFGAIDTLDKPFDLDKLVARVRSLVPPTQ